METPQYILNRGECYLDEKFLGHTVQLSLFHTKDGVVARFVTDNISDEDYQRFVDKHPAPCTFRFSSKSPRGRDINFDGKGRISPVRLDFYNKDRNDDWMRTEFEITFDEFAMDISEVV